MLLFIGLVALVILIVLSAFWSGAETALTSLSKYRIKKLITLNKSLSATLGQWLRAPYYLITVILVGNTVNDLSLSYVASFILLYLLTPLMAYVPREAVEIFNLVFITFVLLILGEVTPKIFSRRNPEKVTLAVMPVLDGFTRVTSLVFTPVSALIKKLFPKVDLVPVGRLTYVTLEEIQGLITEANTSGVLAKETSQMLERVLKLGKLRVSQIMTPVDKIDAVNLYQEEEKFLDRLVETGRSRVPVYNSTINKIAGFVHTKDLLWCWRNNQGAFSREIIRPPYFVPMDKKVSELLREFQTGKMHLAFVLDGVGNVAGLVTLEDVLEDIVGEILDEYDVKKKKQP